MSLRIFFSLFLTFAMLHSPAASADSCNKNGVIVYSKDCLDQLARDRVARQKKQSPAPRPAEQTTAPNIAPQRRTDTNNATTNDTEVTIRRRATPAVAPSMTGQTQAPTTPAKKSPSAPPLPTSNKPEAISTQAPTPEKHQLPVAPQTTIPSGEDQIKAVADSGSALADQHTNRAVAPAPSTTPAPEGSASQSQSQSLSLVKSQPPSAAEAISPDDGTQPDSIPFQMPDLRQLSADRQPASPLPRPDSPEPAVSDALASRPASMELAPADLAPADQAACADDKIIQAAEKGLLDILKQCTPSPEQLNHIDTRRRSYGRTPLHWGALSGSSQLVAYLISQRADTTQRARMDRGAQPAHLAALSGNTDILALLQESNSDLMDKDYLKQTPLHLAARNGSRQTVQWLLSQGADLEARDRMGRTPLMTAARYNNPDAAQALLEAGANPGPTTPKGLTALHFAAQHSLSVARLLLNSGVDINAETLEGQTPLSRLASDRYNRYQTNIEFLLNNGATLSHSGATLLSSSIASNRLSLFKQLLSMGANPDQLTLSRLKNKPLFVQALNESGHL